ncbi:heavy-metal-associated domain-containing protein [Novipirellula artificiosorum]|uniref:Heavy-metal-associated domain protein n=1 Tax=Novipirellula artificiosorum TaxID=2528016 RepID=A0A5C6DHI3_9BACT|nr:heavy-metal-associated domain-containing protein [Novipirellula artificiosorum]TWU34506.1 hypothetical protein Poly41_46540 [Novipirellula artificiosorum]
MRGIAYSVAALAAVIIIVAIAKMPAQVGSEGAGANLTTDAGTVLTSARVMDTEGELTLEVPDMHCPFSCYPRVKELLEGSEAVEEVELAEQQEEGVIDNRQVIVHFHPGFNVDQAIAKLAKEGFAKSDVAN